MPGGSLADQIARGKFSLEDTARIINKIAQGLAYAHKKGIIHRDLKPDNILFDDSGDPFISDFGVAKLAESTSSLSGSRVIGTPAYMSPEQAQGSDVDSRSDVYGLGVIVYQMLTGQQPYRADTPTGVAVKHVTEPVPEIFKVVPSLSAEMDKFIKSEMAKDRNDRFATPTDLARNLNLTAFGEDMTSTAGFGAPRAATSTARPGSRRLMGTIITIGLILLVLAAGFLFRAPIMGLVSPPTSTPMPTATPLPPTPTIRPTETVAPTATSIPFAAYCQPDTVQVPTPAVRRTNLDCVKKSPYTTVSIPL